MYESHCNLDISQLIKNYWQKKKKNHILNMYNMYNMYVLLQMLYILLALLKKILYAVFAYQDWSLLRLKFYGQRDQIVLGFKLALT
jgi:hypothetical protein